MEDLKAKIGTALLPAVTGITSFFATQFVPGLVAVGEGIGQVGGFIASNIEYFTGFGIAIGAVVVPALWAKVAALTASAVAWAATAAAMLVANAPLVAFVAIIGGLTAAVVWAYQNVDVFRNAVDTVARFITGTVVPAVGSLVEWFGNLIVKGAELAIGIGDNIADIVEFFTGLPSKLADVAGDVFGFLRESFRDALNFIIDGWNGLEFKIPGFKIGPVGYDGFTLGMPDIPKFADGGVVPGLRGSPQLILAHGGETILPTHKQDWGEATAGGRAGNTLVQNIYNPAPEPASDSILTAGRRAASLMGGG